MYSIYLQSQYQPITILLPLHRVDGEFGKEYIAAGGQHHDEGVLGVLVEERDGPDLLLHRVELVLRAQAAILEVKHLRWILCVE